MKDSGIGVGGMMPTVFCESVLCDKGPSCLPGGEEVSLPAPQEFPRDPRTWQPRGIFVVPHDGMFQPFVILVVK